MRKQLVRLFLCVSVGKDGQGDGFYYVIKEHSTGTIFPDTGLPALRSILLIDISVQLIYNEFVRSKNFAF